MLISRWLLQDRIAAADGIGAGIGGPIGLQLAKNRAKVATAPAIVFTSLPLNLRDRTNDPTDFDGDAKKMASSGVRLVKPSPNGRHPCAEPPATQPTAQPNTHRKVSTGQTIIAVARRPWSKNIFH